MIISTSSQFVIICASHQSCYDKLYGSPDLDRIHNILKFECLENMLFGKISLQSPKPYNMHDEWRQWTTFKCE